jgi:hypothetical protein
MHRIPARNSLVLEAFWAGKKREAREEIEMAFIEEGDLERGLGFRAGRGDAIEQLQVLPCSWRSPSRR